MKSPRCLQQLSFGLHPLGPQLCDDQSQAICPIGPLDITSMAACLCQLGVYLGLFEECLCACLEIVRDKMLAYSEELVVLWVLALSI